jgi:PEP-CTERM motif
MVGTGHMKSSLAAAFVAAAVIAAPGHADIIPNTGITGPNDPNWSVSWGLVAGGGTNGVDFGTEGNAPLVTVIPSPPWQPNISGNNWIGVDSTATIAGAIGDGSHRYRYVFSTSITLPAPEVLSGALGYDNYFMGAFIGGSFNPSAGTFTGGTEFLSPTQLLGAGKESKSGFCRDSDGFLPSSSFPNCTVDFLVSLPAGTSTINFVIEGDGVTDGFILNQEGVNTGVGLIPEPATLALLGLALAGIGLARRRELH